MRTCGWCRGAIASTARRDANTCSQRCRQAAHRFYRGCVARRRASQPLRLAYADPPYPGKARIYADHPDYAGEVDHRALLSRLQRFDGWALSTSAEALPDLLAMCRRDLDATIRVAGWFRGPRRTLSTWPLSSWEPVVFAGGRQLPSRDDRRDALVHVARPRMTDPARIVGAKPAAFCWWLFDLLGALPGDELVDLFPGSGGVARAWGRYASAAADRDNVAPRAIVDASRDVEREPEKGPASLPGLLFPPCGT